jgi:hypothetical protein
MKSASFQNEKSQTLSAKQITSILDLIDFTTPNANWKNFDGFLNEINHEVITNRIKIRQRIIPICGGNKIVTAGCAEGCCDIDNHQYEKWRRVALYIIEAPCDAFFGDNNCNICRKKYEPRDCVIIEDYNPITSSVYCDDCLEVVNSSKTYHIGAVSFNRILTIVATTNHIMFCYEITSGHRVDILCKSVTASKWNDIRMIVPNKDDPIHLDMVGVHNEHCFNKYNPCKCVKLSKQIFNINLCKYTIFKYIDLLMEDPDAIGVIMKWFIQID